MAGKAEGPPIREIITNAYHQRNDPDAIGGVAQIKPTPLVRDILQPALRLEVRLRLIRREAVDLKPDPEAPAHVRIRPRTVRAHHEGGDLDRDE